MNVFKQPDGKYLVVNGGNVLAGPFDTNAQAWRALDRISGEPISRSEKVSMWINEQIGEAT